MAGSRFAPFRAGDIAEELGMVLLQMLAFVAPVPRPEDHGLDAVATLIRKHRKKLLAEQAFYVQFKLDSVPELLPPYKGHAIKWLAELELPLFIGRVNLERSEIALYTSHNVNQYLVQPAAFPKKLRCFFGKEIPSGIRTRPGTCPIPLGDPALCWSLTRVSDKHYMAHCRDVLKEWLRLEKPNAELRKLGYLRLIRWEPGSFPTAGGDASNLMPGSDLSAAIPYIRLLAQYCLNYRPREERAIFAQLFQWLRSIRQMPPYDPDPGDRLLSISSAQEEFYKPIQRSQRRAE